MNRMNPKNLLTREEIEELAKEPEQDEINKDARISSDSKSLLVRIPKEIVDYYKIESGQSLNFYTLITKEKKDSGLQISLKR